MIFVIFCFSKSGGAVSALRADFEPQARRTSKFAHCTCASCSLGLVRISADHASAAGVAVLWLRRRRAAFFGGHHLGCSRTFIGLESSRARAILGA